MSAPFDKADYHPLKAFAFEALTVSGTAVGFTAATYAPTGATAAPTALAAFVSVEGGGIRYRASGTPTSSVGTLYNDGDDFVVWGTMDIQSILFIATAGDVTLNTHFAN